MNNVIETGLWCALVGTMFAGARPELFAYWYDLLLWAETKGKFLAWLSKPLGLCHLCASGQLAFWTHFYLSGWDDSLEGFAHHIMAASLAILCAAIIYKVYQWATS